MSSLTDHTSRGFAWMTLQAASAKVTSLIGQIALAYLLVPEHFGLAALANTVYNFAALLQQAGLRQVLVSRGKSFRLWSGPATWMSLCLGAVSTLGMLAAAWPMALAYDEPKLALLIAVMSPCMIIDAYAVVPIARAQVELRFKLIAFANWAATVGQMLSCVTFAAFGLGAMSFSLSVLVQILTRAVIMGRFAGGMPTFRLRVRRWKYLLGDSAWLFAASIAQCAVGAAPALLLGKAVSAEAVGLFAFALNISLQSVLLITIQLEGVLFATLSRLRDQPLRQARAFLRATGVLALIAMPMCLMQAALADPAIRLVFQPKWYDAIAPIQALSVAMAFVATTYSMISLVNAQGRFRTYFKLTFFSLFTTAVFIAGALEWWGLFSTKAVPLAATAVALAVGTQLIIYSAISLHRAIHPPALRDEPGRPTWADVFRTLFLPFAVAVLAIAPGWALAQLLPHSSKPGLIAQGFVTAFLGGFLYLILARFLLPGPWTELLERLHPLLSRIPIIRDVAQALRPQLPPSGDTIVNE